MKTTVRAILLVPLPPAVSELMARYCAALRCAYRRLLQGQRALEIEKSVAAQYALNSRYAKDAVYEAAVLIRSQNTLVGLRVRQWQRKLQGAERKLARARSPAKQAGLAAKVGKRRRRLAFWQRHLEAGTHPPVVFGGRQAFRDRCAGKISRAEWRDRRSQRLLARGDKSKGGNLQLRLTPGGPGGAVLQIAVPGAGRIADRVQVPIYLPQKVSKRTGRVNGIDWRQLVLGYLATGRAYHVELVRRQDTARRHRRSNRAGELAARVVDLAQATGAALVVEDLRFVDDREVTRKFHRLSHPFAYRRLLVAIERRAARAGVMLVKVHPAYTSAIGALKYSHQYRLSIHQAAAVVIARRGMGLKERVPLPLRRLVRNVEYLTEWKAWAALKKAALKQLQLKGVKSLVSWPQYWRSVLGPAERGA